MLLRRSLLWRRFCPALSLALFASSRIGAAQAQADGLLFYLSGDHGVVADVAAPGTAEPTFEYEITQIADGAKGGALSCGNFQRLAYRAPGNIQAQRGTLSFFWRSRDPVGPTEFPVFRVGYADHSSWDMVFLRIDYNGHGFDAFVTDANLSRVRVSVTMDPFPAANVWTHLALAWDETRGIRFYINGKLAATNTTSAVYDAALDQFGPHSRIISPYQVQSDYNFTRGGDIDEVRIYDRMLKDESMVVLAKTDAAPAEPLLTRSLADKATRDEWWLRYGFNRPNDPPPLLPSSPTVTVRKVEIDNVYDKGRWWWKATDGIRETTWPGVYNRSRLPGRHDYFTLPDWDCYVESGKAITFELPNEPWNHLEISGSAWGKVEILPLATVMEKAADATAQSQLFERPKSQEKTIHTLTKPMTAQKLRFTNVEQEQPISEFEALNVTTGTEPAGSRKLAFKLHAAVSDSASTSQLRTFIAGRFPQDERETMVGVPSDSPAAATQATMARSGGLPIVHILIPDTWDKLTDGLDGIAIDLPALKVKPTHGKLFPLNLQVKDPLWTLRDMIDFTFSVKPGEAHTLWLDLRDRLLPAGKGLYVTIAGAGEDFRAGSLEGAEIRLVFKPREAARAEHEVDRFTQMKDSYAMLVEEHPKSPKYDLWNRFEGDLKDLLRVNPNHLLGLQYAAAAFDAPPPGYMQSTPPSGVPLWAFRQTELLGEVKRFVLWYVDHRQSAFGDFGGGISDDVDLVNTWPGVALMGCEPDKIRKSDNALLDAAFKNGMFTNGLPTIQADELHSYEEGINCLAQNMIVDFGSPRQIERAMSTARGVESLTGINAAGHRHIRTSYYNGLKMSVDGPWGWSKPYSYLVCQVPQLLVEYNGNPEAKKFLIELADGLLAHRKVGTGGERGSLPAAIHFVDDKEGEAARGYNPWHIFWGAWKWTGDRRYLDPIFDGGITAVTGVNANTLDILNLRQEYGPRILGGERGQSAETRTKDFRPPSKNNATRTTGTAHFVWQLGGDKTVLEKLYATQLEECVRMDYINTEGSLWIDRVAVPYAELQRARLGGVALLRNSLFPGHVVSWKFAAPANDQSVAVLIPNGSPTSFKVIAYNLETTPVHATMTGWNIDPGTWEITQGIDSNNDDTADGEIETHSVGFERSRSLELTLPPRATTVLTLKLKTPGTPYWQRSDLGLDRGDVKINGRDVKVTVHSIGSLPAPAARLLVRGADGQVIASAAIPALAAPIDLHPKTADVSLRLPTNAQLKGASVEIEPAAGTEEITAMNNRVML